MNARCDAFGLAGIEDRSPRRDVVGMIKLGGQAHGSREVVWPYKHSINAFDSKNVIDTIDRIDMFDLYRHENVVVGGPDILLKVCTILICPAETDSTITHGRIFGRLNEQFGIFPVHHKWSDDSLCTGIQIPFNQGIIYTVKPDDIGAIRVPRVHSLKHLLYLRQVYGGVFCVNTEEIEAS